MHLQPSSLAAPAPLLPLTHGCMRARGTLFWPSLLSLQLVDNGLRYCWLDEATWDGHSQIWLQCRAGYYAWLRKDGDSAPEIAYAHHERNFRFHTSWEARVTKWPLTDHVLAVDVWGC